MVGARTFLPLGKMSISKKFQLLDRDAQKVEDGRDVDVLHRRPPTFRAPRPYPAWKKASRSASFMRGSTGQEGATARGSVRCAGHAPAKQTTAGKCGSGALCLERPLRTASPSFPRRQGVRDRSLPPCTSLLRTSMHSLRVCVVAFLGDLDTTSKADTACHRPRALPLPRPHVVCA